MRDTFSLIWKHRLAAAALVIVVVNLLILGIFEGWLAFLSGIIIFLMGFSFPIAVANVQVKEDEAAEEAEEGSLEESLLQLERDGLIQIDRSQREPEKKTE